MCGRVACNQCPEVYQKATSYYDSKTRKYVKSEWHQVPNDVEFKPSCNVAPTDVTPVLISGDVISTLNTERVLQPMMWGLIPPWHTGSYKTHGLSTHNCRIETMASSKLYQPSLKEGKRCVVICDGFYEWQTAVKAKVKQPYFIYSTQDHKVKVEDESSWSVAEWDSCSGWNGPRVLCMAGLYNVWNNPEGKDIYSYTVITRESKKDFSWLHHRVPAILSTEQQIQDWIDTKRVNLYEALKVLDVEEQSPLAWHQVSTYVNKSTNKSPQCNKKIEIKKSTFLTSWLKKGETSKRESEPSSDCDPVKKVKKEDLSP